MLLRGDVQTNCPMARYSAGKGALLFNFRTRGTPPLCPTSAPIAFIFARGFREFQDFGDNRHAVDKGRAHMVRGICSLLHARGGSGARGAARPARIYRRRTAHPQRARSGNGRAQGSAWGGRDEGRGEFSRCGCGPQARRYPAADRPQARCKRDASAGFHRRQARGHHGHGVDLAPGKVPGGAGQARCQTGEERKGRGGGDRGSRSRRSGTAPAHAGGAGRACAGARGSRASDGRARVRAGCKRAASSRRRRTGAERFRGAGHERGAGGGKRHAGAKRARGAARERVAGSGRQRA